MRDFIIDVLLICGYLIAWVFVFSLAIVGAVMIFGSFFFEQTRSQMTWFIVVQHVGIFLAGIVCAAISTRLGATLLRL